MALLSVSPITRDRLWLGAVFAGMPLLAASLVVTPNPAAAVDESTASAVVLSGPVPAGTTTVEVYAAADDPKAESGPMETWQVPVQGVLADGHYTARVDPASIPERMIRSGGLVDFEVIAHDPSGQTSSVWATASMAQVGETLDWADPLEIPPAFDTGADRRARQTVRSTTVQLRDGDRVRVAAVDQSRSGSGRSTELDAGVVLDQFPAFESGSAPATEISSASTVESAATCRYPYWEYTDTYRTRPATIGTGYPVSTDRSRMNVSSSSGARYGVAASASSAWGGGYANGSRYVRSGWSFTWAWSGAQRSFRKGIRYQLMRKKCYGTGTLSAPRFMWRPYSETGGTSSVEGLTRPSWSTCAGVDRGVWSRDNSNGDAYAYGASVKMKDVIGIDLSIERNYTASQRLQYDLKRRRRLCGNGREPAWAGKIIDRLL